MTCNPHLSSNLFMICEHVNDCEINGDIASGSQNGTRRVASRESRRITSRTSYIKQRDIVSLYISSIEPTNFSPYAAGIRLK